MSSIGLSIAVVDDEEPVRSSLTRLLRSAGYETSAHASGHDFLESLEGIRPDCVVLDLRMPGLNGHEVQARMKTRGLRIPVVIITAHEMPGARERACDAGAASFLRKPIDDSDLLAAIEAAIR